MKNILILANGNVAKHFVQRVNESRIDNNHYYITCDNSKIFSQNGEGNHSFIEIDPTSYLKLKNIMDSVEFTVVFIVMSKKSEALFSYKNVRVIQPKIRVVFVSNWDELKLNDENTELININELIASTLYERLPNVPIIAKNIGLAQGEIMEVRVSFGSPYAYRHVGSITHRKWHIVAIYREEKQIFPTNATMIKPNDRLIIMGNPRVLEEVYKRITKRKGLFPEPFGKNLYLILDTHDTKENILLQVNEAIFLSNKFTKSKLYISLVGEANSDIVEELSKFESKYITIFQIGKQEIIETIGYEISQYEVGLFLINIGFFRRVFQDILYLEKRPIYIFGEKAIYNISKAVILMGNEIEMESISSSVFDLSETLGLKLSLCNFDPEGDFMEKKTIIEHYETLSNIYGLKLDIQQKKANPIRELRERNDILHIVPFNKTVLKRPILNFFSRDFSRYFLNIKNHPRLLIPIEE